MSGGAQRLVRLVLASANPHKAAEIQAILSATLPGVEILPRPPAIPEVEETGATLEENARLKAVAVMSFTGDPAVADDTGLEVAALDGAPGVISARFAGPGASYADNVAKLLAVMEDVSDRRARFRTVATACFPAGLEVRSEGVVEGHIATAPRGSAGFGYDPVFVPEHGGGMTFAEMDAAVKNSMSHRGLAFRALAIELSGIW